MFRKIFASLLFLSIPLTAESQEVAVEVTAGAGASFLFPEEYEHGLSAISGLGVMVHDTRYGSILRVSASQTIWPFGDRFWLQNAVDYEGLATIHGNVSRNLNGYLGIGPVLRNISYQEEKSIGFGIVIEGGYIVETPWNWLRLKSGNRFHVTSTGLDMFITVGALLG